MNSVRHSFERVVESPVSAGASKQLFFACSFSWLCRFGRVLLVFMVASIATIGGPAANTQPPDMEVLKLARGRLLEQIKNSALLDGEQKHFLLPKIPMLPPSKIESLRGLLTSGAESPSQSKDLRSLLTPSTFAVSSKRKMDAFLGTLLEVSSDSAHRPPPRLLELLIRSQSIGIRRKQELLNLFPKMNAAQREALLEILEDEYRQLLTLEVKLENELRVMRQKHLKHRTYTARANSLAHSQASRERSTLQTPRLVLNGGHSDDVAAVAYSATGNIVASGSRDGVIVLWHETTGRTLRYLRAHTREIASLRFSPHANVLASASWDGTVKLWNIETGSEIGDLSRENTQASSVEFSPDGQQLVAGYADKSVVVWEISSRRKLRVFHGHADAVSAVAFGKDGRTIFSGSFDKTLKQWDLVSGRVLRTLSGHAKNVISLALSPDGTVVASGGGDGSLKLWDVSDGRELHTLSADKFAVHSIAFNPDGSSIVSGGGEETLKMWNTKSGHEMLRLRGHESSVSSIAFSPDGSKVVSGSDDKTVRLWDLTYASSPRTLGGQVDWVRSVAFGSRDGGVITAHGNMANWWDTGTSGVVRRLGEHSGWVSSVAVSSDKVATSGGRSLKLSNAENSARLWEDVIAINAITFSRDGSVIVSGGDDNLLKLWDVATGRVKAEFRGHDGPVSAVAVSPDGRLLVSGGEDLRLVFRDFASGKVVRVLSGHKQVINSVAFNSRGDTLVSACDDGTIVLWDTHTGEMRRSWKGHSDAVNAVAFSPDGLRLVSASSDHSIAIWETLSGAQPLLLSGHSDQVLSVAYSADGRFVVSGSADGSSKIWRASDGKELASLMSFRDGTWVVTTPEGRFDTGDLESMPHLHWVMPDDPFTPVPREVFMRDYYEPRLLARIIAGEKLPPVRPLMSLNRTQPEVRITSVVPNANDPSLVSVTVTASGATKNYLQGDGSAGGKEIARATAAHDLRLFRDGQVVGYADGKLADFEGTPFTKTFTVRLPQAKAGQEVMFSAYAFNDDRVKSETVRTTFKAPASKNTTTTTGKAYVVTIGVNQHENRAWNLSFAANDARAVAARVAGDLRKAGRYDEVVSVTLAADGPVPVSWQASKAAIRAVFARLSGTSAGQLPEVLRGVEGAEALRRVTPDDTLIIAFSGHGFTDEQGMFYLMPQDTGEGQGKTVTPLLHSRSISSDELSVWLRDVDAGDMTMIVDACQSAASIASEGFKPGPMGSRGLGQLSFDKGMRILAASQSDQYALEDAKLRHGLLTFSLINDGLDAFNADHEPKDKTIYLDEWLKYGVKRVPTLWEEVKLGKVVVANRSADRGGPVVLGAIDAQAAAPATTRQQAQTPALFDFAKNRKPVMLLRAVGEQ